MNNILLIVEGAVTEKNIFNDIFTKYGFNTIIKKSIDIEDIGQFEKYEYSSSLNNVVIIQGPRNRIHDLLLLLKDKMISIEKIFYYAYAYFQGIFLIYDVDHNDDDDLQEAFKLFSDETSGMLLLSSPCIEVLADYDRNRKSITCNHINEYKADINKHYNGGTRKFVSENFSNLLLYFLDKNTFDFKNTNVMLHPQLILESIKRNLRFNDPYNKENSYAIYRYFSTVIYCCNCIC